MARAKETKRVHLHIETMAALLLLIVLASLTVLLIFTTGETYRRNTAGGENAQELRTGLLFVATKVRQTDGKAAVRSCPWGSALVLTTASDGQTFEDWILFYQGTLREGTVQAGEAVNPSAFPVIATLRSFAIAQSGRELRLTATAGALPGERQTRNLTLALRD